MRCLADAVLDLPISAREYQATSPGESEELRSEYLVDDRLDLSGWARDAVVLALPDKILCRPDCAGLCPVCGRDLNDEPHEHDEEPDSRWSALAELRDRLCYTARPLMAVPKKKTSKARRDKRRAAAPHRGAARERLPGLPPAEAPHRVCPTCKTYRGRDDRAAPPRPVAP